MNLTFTQKQEQTLSPQLIQSVEILQMTAQELLEYLENVSLENPVLEFQVPCDSPNENDNLYARLEWLKSTDPQNRDYHQQDSEADIVSLFKYGAEEGNAESLYNHILVQLEELNLPPEIVVCAQILAGCLDTNGWLQENLAALAQEFCKPETAMDQALTVVQALDPAGIAARSLSECLCLQLLRRTPVSALAVQIAGEWLEALSMNHYGLIARTLGVGQEEVRRACDLIRSLDPRPGAKFSPGAQPVYIMPDVIVTKASGKLELSLSRHFLPSLNINPYYAQLLKESDDGQVKQYLTTKVKQVKWVIQAVEQRNKTLLSCAECIVNAQKDFFLHGGHIKPLTMAEVAGWIGVHESTVSRAVSGKYLQCTKGAYPFSYFFSRRLGSKSGKSEMSPDTAKTLLKKIIDEEDKQKPLSDQKLCERLATQGCVLARRTVAKYRDELGISGTTGRKQFP